MSCDTQNLLTDARCIAALNGSMVNVVIAALYCRIAGLIFPPDAVALQSETDGLWYRIYPYQVDGIVQLVFGQTPVSPGPNPYLVLLNETDGLFYKFKLYTEDGTVTGGYDGSGATLEPETPTSFTVSGVLYDLLFLTDEGTITFDLVP